MQRNFNLQQYVAWNTRVYYQFPIVAHPQEDEPAPIEEASEEVKRLKSLQIIIGLFSVSFKRVYVEIFSEPKWSFLALHAWCAWLSLAIKLARPFQALVLRTHVVQALGRVQLA